MVKNIAFDKYDDSAFKVTFINREGEEQNGPLALLWRLIESYEVDIFEVSLTRIVDDFLSFIRENDLSLEEESDFAVMAARLIYYKSKLLLPNPGFEEDYESDVLPEELVEQLLEYKRFQYAAEILSGFEEKNHMSYSRDAIWHQYEKEVDFLQVDLVSFLKVFRDFLDKSEKERPIVIEEEDISVEDMITEINKKLIIHQQLSFFMLISTYSFFKCIVAFLAVLEMARLKFTSVTQEQQNEDITLIALSSGTPDDEQSAAGENE